MKELLFVAVEKFDPSHEGWKKFIEWSKLLHLTEVISLDCSLCPPVVKKALAEDWNHIADEVFIGFYFRDRDYFMNRTKNIRNRNLLAVVLEPDSDDQTRNIEGGCLLGYDLIERDSGISALTNCGGFPESFDNEELNQFGLMPDYVRAKQVQVALLANNPDEPHANTELWAIWKLRE